MSTRRAWLSPLLLLILGSVSVVFGALQVWLLQQGVVGRGNDMAVAHYFTMPLPIVLHIVSGSLFNLLLPLQFAGPVRARWPALHRLLGRVLTLCAIAFGLSALWMNELYPQYGGVAKYSAIVAHSALLLTALAVALVAIGKGDVRRHRIWMMRLTAVALSPATQRLFVVPGVALFGPGWLNDAVIGAVIWAGLIVNLGFVEWRLCRTGSRRVPSAPPSVPAPIAVRSGH